MNMDIESRIQLLIQQLRRGRKSVIVPAFLSALAFMFTILLADPGIGVLVSLGLWAVQSMGQVLTLSGISWNLPDLTAMEVRPWLWASTLLFFVVALWASGRDERWLRRPI